MNSHTSRWLKGIVAGFIRGGAHSVTVSGIVTVFDNKDFNPITGFWHMMAFTLTCFLASGVIATMFYLQNNPLPIEEDTDKP